MTKENIAAQLNTIKILEHGKRADHIVENHIEHNNSNSGVYFINCVKDIALAYYGLRANKNNFNT